MTTSALALHGTDLLVDSAGYIFVRETTPYVLACAGDVEISGHHLETASIRMPRAVRTKGRIEMVAFRRDFAIDGYETLDAKGSHVEFIDCDLPAIVLKVDAATCMIAKSRPSSSFRVPNGSSFTGRLVVDRDAAAAFGTRISVDGDLVVLGTSSDPLDLVHAEGLVVGGRLVVHDPARVSLPASAKVGGGIVHAVPPPTRDPSLVDLARALAGGLARLAGGGRRPALGQGGTP